MSTQEAEDKKNIAKRRSFYVDDELWYPFLSKLWSEKSNASKWIREMIKWYLSEEE